MIDNTFHLHSGFFAIPKYVINLPPYSIYPELRSERILLRQLRASEAKNIIDITFFQRVPAKNEDDVVSMLQKIDERYANGESVHWGIEDLQQKEMIGCCGFYRGFANDSGEIGYFLKEKFRNRGYMSEAVKLMVQFGFETMRLKKIFAITAPDNLASQGVLRKNKFIAAGMEENGDLRFHRIP